MTAAQRTVWATGKVQFGVHANGGLIQEQEA